jgi:hypothetical protein
VCFSGKSSPTFQSRVVNSPIFIGQKTNSQSVAQECYSSIANCQTKIPALFVGLFGNFQGVLKFFKFIPHFLAKSLTMFCRTLGGNLAVKHCFIPTVLFLYVAVQNSKRLFNIYFSSH